MTIRLHEYLNLISVKIKEAEDQKNLDECLRLSDLMISVIHEYQDKVRNVAASGIVLT